jgi:hypothetical protein
MKIAFRETRNFTAILEEYFSSDDEYRALQNFLMVNPERGPIIPGTGHLRKLRRADARRGKGKRGGLRSSISGFLKRVISGLSMSMTRTRKTTSPATSAKFWCNWQTRCGKTYSHARQEDERTDKINTSAAL